MLIRLFAALVVLVLLVVGYFFAALSWNYSTGERAGWVQKLSHKGWLCKTWEGEMAMVSLPGSTPEKFFFTVRDDAVAGDIQKIMGKRVSLHYEEKVGLPTTCFGETRHYVTKVQAEFDQPGMPGELTPVPPAAAAPAPAAPPVSSAPVPPAAVPSAPAPAASN